MIKLRDIGGKRKPTYSWLGLLQSPLITVEYVKFFKCSSGTLDTASRRSAARLKSLLKYPSLNGWIWSKCWICALNLNFNTCTNSFHAFSNAYDPLKMRPILLRMSSILLSCRPWSFYESEIFASRTVVWMPWANLCHFRGSPLNWLNS